jgi:MYXO-CTERM domain-containing protein
VPTAKGNRPSATIVPGGGSHGPGSSGGAISAGTVRTLDGQGSAGRQAVALAEAAAPVADATSRSSRRPGAKVKAPTAPGANVSQQPSGASPITGAVNALTGSSSGGGLGPVLPIILIASLFGVAMLALLRRRRET